MKKIKKKNKFIVKTNEKQNRLKFEKKRNRPQFRKRKKK